MELTTLFSELSSRALSLRYRGNEQIEVVGDQKKLTPAIIAGLVEHKPTFLRLLKPKPKPFDAGEAKVIVSQMLERIAAESPPDYHIDNDRDVWNRLEDAVDEARSKRDWSDFITAVSNFESEVVRLFEAHDAGEERREREAIVWAQSEEAKKIGAISDFPPVWNGKPDPIVNHWLQAAHRLREKYRIAPPDFSTPRRLVSNGYPPRRSPTPPENITVNPGESHWWRLEEPE